MVNEVFVLKSELGIFLAEARGVSLRK